MILVAGGDSFVWGSELADSPNGSPSGYSRSTFPALLANQSKSEYVCAAYPGISNYKIVTRLKEKIHQNTPAVVVVCWTWPTRDSVWISRLVIKNFQRYCERHNIPYLFTCVDNCLIELLGSNISMDNWYMFPAGITDNDTVTPRGFYQWAVENKYSIGPAGHPLEDAHRDAANLIKEKFDEMVKKFNKSH